MMSINCLNSHTILIMRSIWTTLRFDRPLLLSKKESMILSKNQIGRRKWLMSGIKQMLTKIELSMTVRVKQLKKQMLHECQLRAIQNVWMTQRKILPKLISMQAQWPRRPSKKRAENRMAQAIAAEVLVNNPKLKAVHSKESIKKILEKEALK